MTEIKLLDRAGRDRGSPGRDTHLQLKAELHRPSRTVDLSLLPPENRRLSTVDKHLAICNDARSLLFGRLTLGTLQHPGRSTLNWFPDSIAPSKQKIGGRCR